MVSDCVGAFARGTYEIDGFGILGDNVVPVRRQICRGCGAGVPVVEIVNADEDGEERP